MVGPYNQNQEVIKENIKSCKDDYNIIFKLHKKKKLIQDYWVHQTTLGFSKKTQMGYYMQDYCRCLCLCLSTLGPIEMNSLIDYCMDK